MRDSMEIMGISDGSGYVVMIEDDRPPFSIMTLGTIKKDHEGFYRFHPNDDIDMTCKQLRGLAVYVGELN